jgi:hypothetical protein
LQRCSDVFDIPVSTIILLAENENETAYTFRGRVRANLRKRILALHERMGDERVEVDKASMRDPFGTAARDSRETTAPLSFEADAP